MNHELRGLHSLELSKDFTKVERLNTIDSIELGFGSNFINFSNSFYYTSANGVYKLAQSSGKFEKDSIISNILDNYNTTSTLLAVNATGQVKWCFADNNILLLSPGSLSDKPNLEEIPVSIPNFRKVVVGFENLTKISDTDYLLGSSNGYFVLKSDAPKQDNAQQIHINNIEANINNEPKTQLSLAASPSLNYKNNNLNFSYSIPQYGNIVDLIYAYKLEG